MTPLTMVLFVLGIMVAGAEGAEVLGRGASRLAAALGISPLVIGLTVDRLRPLSDALVTQQKRFATATEQIIQLPLGRIPEKVHQQCGTPSARSAAGCSGASCQRGSGRSRPGRRRVH